MRKIYISGDISEESFKEFCEKLDELENEGSAPVELELNSIGGNALDAIAFLGRMRTSKVDINVTVYGLAGSAAVLVLAAGDYRRMTKESWLYVHEDSGSYRSINTTGIEKQAALARMFEDQWAAILEDLTGTKRDKWAELHKEELYITSKDCVLLGIVDEVI